MKTTDKISSFLGSLVIAFAITLFIPSASHATWNNYSSYSSSSSSKGDSSSSGKSSNSSSSSSKCDSSSSDKSSNSSSSNGDSSSSGDSKKCAKYKTLADKYLKEYYKCYSYSYYQKYIYYMKKYKECEANLNKTGKVCGKVFEDTNDNGSYDSTDKPLANVDVKVTDSKGKVQTVTTNAKGYYCASNVAVGTASVDIDETTLPVNPTQVVGTDPTDVDVKANTKNWEEKNGYTFPIPTGKVCGTVYEDINGNGQQDDNETGVAGIEVKIIDANGDEHTVVTDNSGKYCQDNVAEGSASITVNEATLPTDATLTAGENPNDITVVANQDNDALTDGYTLPTPVGSACGFVIVDGQGQAGVTVTLMDSEGNTHSEVTNADGKYCFKDIPQGDATVDVDDATLPDGAELTAGEDSSDVTIVANTENDAGTDEYTLPIPVGNVCGQVVVDGDGQEDVNLTITDANGDTHTVTTDTDGKWCANGLPEGDATVDVDESTLPAGVERVLGEDQDTYSVIANENADAGIDGYETIPTGTVCGIIFEDVDKDQFQNVGEQGLSNVTVNVTDSKNNVLAGVTNATGNYCIPGVAEGSATVAVDTNTLPNGAIDTTLVDPSPVNVIADTNNDAGSDGYYIPNTELGSIHGTIFCDTNENGIYDDTDTRLDGITVTVTDAEGNVYVTETGAEGGHLSGKGTYHLAVKPGEAKIVIDINDPDLPASCNTVGIGYNPDFTDVVAGQISYAGGYGFLLNSNP